MKGASNIFMFSSDTINVDIANQINVEYSYILGNKIKLNDYSSDTLDKVIFELTNQILLLKIELSDLKLKLDETYYRRGVSY